MIFNCPECGKEIDSDNPPIKMIATGHGVFCCREEFEKWMWDNGHFQSSV